MKVLTKKDSRISFFFNSFERISDRLNLLFKEYKPLFNGDRYVTDEELSTRLNIHRRTLASYRKKGILPYIYFGGKILYSEKDILKIMGELREDSSCEIQ